MQKVKSSLLIKFVILCVGLVLFTSLTMWYFSFKTAKKVTIETMGKTALDVTESVVKCIDPEKFNKLQTEQDMESDYYSELRNQLNDIRSDTGLKYLYTMRKTGDGKYIYVVDGTSSLEDASKLGTVENEISSVMKAGFDGQKGYELDMGEEWGDLVSAYVPITDSTGKTIGILAADFEAGFLVKQLKDLNQNMILSAAVIILISMLMAAAFSYWMICSLKQLQKKISLLNDGNLTINVENKRKDEVGSLSRSFQSMIEHITSIIRNIRNSTEAVRLDMNALNNNIDKSNKSTEEITGVINEFAADTADQVEMIENVSNSMKNVFSEIENITENIDQVNSDSDQAMKDMKAASEILKGSVQQINIVNDTVDSTAVLIRQLGDKFSEVLTFSNTVSVIAKQTNLLALNASIEAASAGEYGKGFAVVADEINKLAKSSADASKRIQVLIHMVQNEVENSSTAIENDVVQARNSVDVISKVDTYLEKLKISNQKVDIKIKDITSAIAHIKEDSKNILENTATLTDISKEFSAGTQQTAAETQEQLSIMEDIRSSLTQVMKRMEQLSMTVNKFIIE